MLVMRERELCRPMSVKALGALSAQVCFDLVNWTNKMSYLLRDMCMTSLLSLNCVFGREFMYKWM